MMHAVRPETFEGTSSKVDACKWRASSLWDAYANRDVWRGVVHGGAANTSPMSLPLWEMSMGKAPLMNC